MHTPITHTITGRTWRRFNGVGYWMQHVLFELGAAVAGDPLPITQSPEPPRTDETPEEGEVPHAEKGENEA